MAFYTVEKRLKADGTPRYRCTVGVKESGKYTYRENRTFSKQAYARTWGIKRTAEIERDGIPSERTEAYSITLGELIDKYLSHPSETPGRSKREALGLVGRRDVAFLDVVTATAKDYVEFARARGAEGVAASTVKFDISNIISVLRSAWPLFEISVNLSAALEARDYLNKLKLISPGNKRTRRPTRDETDLIIAGLKEKEKTAYSKAPFSEIYLFSILTCMRVGELCRIRWQDVDNNSKSVLVRDRKDPRKKEGNHMVVPLLGGAWEILQAQKKDSEFIFPYASRNISLVHSKVRDELGIKDLHYHDLRREGASRLFEYGFSVEEVAQVTGHKNLQTLWTVYREIFPQTLHDRFDELQRQRKNPT